MRSGAAPGQDSAEGKCDAPAHHCACKPRPQVKHEVDDEDPERGTNHQALSQRQAVIGLPQRHPHHDVADGGEHHQLRRQEQQAWKNRRIDGHSGSLRLTIIGGRHRLNR